MTNLRRCIFYRTLAIDHDSRIGSGVRPAKLLEAFEKLGYEVDVVAGSARDRKSAIDEVKRQNAAGTEYDFIYAEPPTTPVPLNESHHFPTHPLLDYRFLAYCHSRGIPVILFYSDVQWRLRDYPRQVGWPKYLAALPFFHLDLFVYRRVVDAWLVPHRGMLPQIAGWAPSVRSWESIPGFDPLETPPPRPAREAGAPLRLFYVGGVTPPVYDLEPLLRGSAWAAGHGLKHELTICCREAEWLRRPAAYERYLGAHVKVAHNRNRQELLELYAAQDIAVMPYGTTNSDWAMPIKFPEAIGMGLPILAGKATAVGQVVAAQGIGWTVGDSDEDLYNVLHGVDRTELERVRSNVNRVRPGYEWAERAREIVAIARELKTPQGDPHPSRETFSGPFA
jgi:glycosyltransferase involved in cell wall biosynthesis